MSKPIKIGAWVAFMRSGCIYYGKVEYRITRQTWEKSDTLITTAGSVMEDAVLEVRQ